MSNLVRVRVRVGIRVRVRVPSCAPVSNLRPDASKASAVVFGGATLVRGRGSGRVRVRVRVRVSVRVRIRVRVRRSDLEGPTGLRGVVTR